MFKFPAKIPYARPLAIAAGLFLLYVALGFLAGPPLVKHILTHTIADTMKRKISVGEVRVNPLLMSVDIQDFALIETGGAPIAAFKRLHVDFQLSSLPRRAWTFSDIELEGLDLRADVAPGGRFNLLALLQDLPKSEAKPDAKLPRVLLQRIVLSGGAINFSDRAIPTPASTALAPLNLEIHDLSTIPEREGTYAMSARLPGGGTMDWRGDASLQPLASQGEVSIKGVKPLTGWRFIGYRFDFLAEPQGEFDAGARYRFSYAGGATQLAVEELKASGRGIAIATTGAKNVSLALASFELPGGRAEFAAAQGKPWQAKLEVPKFDLAGLEFADRSRATPYRAQIKEATLGFTAAIQENPQGARTRIENVTATVTQLSAGEAGATQPMGTLDTITVEDGSVDVAGRLLAIGRVAVSGGELRVDRDKNGKLPLLKILAPSDEGLLRRELAGVAEAAKAEGKPWHATLGELQVEGVRIALADRSFGEPVAYDLRDLRFNAKGIDTEDKAPLKFDAALRLEQGGSVTASGDARISGQQANLRVKIERVNLKPIQPAIATRARVKLASGEFSADVKAAYRQNAGKHGLKLGGTLRVDNFRVDEADSGERLLAWKALTANGLSLGLAPDQLRIEEARIEGLGAKVVVFKDRSVNLKAMIIEPADAATGKAAVTTGDTEVLFPVAIERVRFEDGNVEFADLSLILPFGAKVHQLAGLVEGVSTERTSRASLKVEGRVDEFGLARAEGSLAPFRPTSFMDLNVIFRNVEMPALSPYAATFAGRRIASGRLSLDLKYKINDGKLSGDNHVVLEKFTLGERVESPDAISLPLDLAIALLTDSDGKIDLTVPVSGDVNDPKFSYGPLIWQAIRTVIGKIVSAPFRALGALFGGGSENLESIAFDPGRAALLPPEQEKLKRVADGLAKRAQIRLVAEGQVGPADRAALQRRDVALAVNTKLGRTPAAGADPDPVNVTDAKTQRALEAVFIERQSEDALAKFVADTAKARGKEVDRVNVALAIVGRGSADQAFYEALLKRLNETANVTDAALAQLAEARARAVTTHLTGKLALAEERATARVAKAPGEALVKLELEVAGAK